MKEYLASLIEASRDPLHARNVVREYLQARILGSLQRSGAMISLAFHGGTALRFLYMLPRHSEDLDFTLERPRGYDFRGYLERIRTEFTAEGYQIELSISDKKTVHHAFVKFRGLLYEMGLAGQPKQVFSVKIEVDTRPPQGAALATTVVRRHVTLQLQHHDRASLLAGKIHALLQRRYMKGRDLYDLLWYLSDPQWPNPNLTLLNNALRQTGWKGPRLTPQNWRTALRERIQGLDWRRVQEDVIPFLENPQDVELLTRENLMRALE